MNPIQLKILIVSAIVTGVILGMMHFRNHFRSSIKKGDVIGVDFGKGVVLNRTVKKINNGGGIVVLDRSAKDDQIVDRKSVYMPSRGDIVDEAYEEDV